MPCLAAPESELSAAVGEAVSDPPGSESTRPGSSPAATVDQPAVDESEIFTEAPLESNTVASMWALFLGLALLMIGVGLNGSVIGVRSGIEGFSLVVTGLIMAGYFAGFLLSPSIVVRMIPSVGHIRVFAGLASTASSAVLIHSVIVVPWVWVTMRFVFGFCAAGLYIVLESWLNEMSPNSRRGRTLAIYMTVSMGGMALGQLLISTSDPAEFTLFVVASVLVSMSLVPMALAATATPPPVRVPDRVSVRELWRLVPTGTIGAFLNGAAVGALLGMAAVYATSAGMSLERTAVFLAAPMIGAIVFQWPVGWISDRVPRRGVILVVAGLAALTASGLALLPVDSILVIALMFLLGGAVFPLYSLVVSFTLDWTPVHRTVATSATLVRVNGAGAIVGPIVAASLMAAIDDAFFFWTIMATNAIVALYVTWRIIVRDPLPMERQRRYLIVPARASEFVLRLAPRPRRRPRPE